MPCKNVVKAYAPDSYYHIYNRGVEKRQIFLDKQDYIVFMNLLKRYLSKEAAKDSYGRDGVTFYGDIELLAYCLMPNHFHMLIYMNEDTKAISELLRRISTCYATYFNKKYERVGSLFQGTFKASRVSSDSYIQHISRYIHLNPAEYLTWEYSSWPYYTKKWESEWIRPNRILDIFEGDSYTDFVADYKSYKNSLEELKYELAN